MVALTDVALTYILIGINTAVVPMYLSEIAPVPLRGATGTLNQMGIVIGLLLGFILGLTQVCNLVSSTQFKVLTILS